MTTTKRKLNSTNQANKKSLQALCPVTFTLDKIGGRWKALLLWHLKGKTLRYSELKKQLPQISEKMLIQQLKDLEADGLVNREARDVVPPFVEYSLTEMGKDLYPLLNAMANWGLKYQ